MARHRVADYELPERQFYARAGQLLDRLERRTLPAASRPLSLEDRKALERVLDSSSWSRRERARELLTLHDAANDQLPVGDQAVHQSLVQHYKRHGNLVGRWPGDSLYVRHERPILAAVGVGSAAVGVVVAPRLNAVVTARPLGRHVPPSVGAAIASGIAGALARRAGMRRTAVAATGFAIGLGVGTALSAKRPGGLLDPSAGGGA